MLQNCGSLKSAPTGNRTRIARRPQILYWNSAIAAYFVLDANKLYDRQLWLHIFSRSMDLGISTVPHLKDLTNICLETEAQGHSLTFCINFTGLKYPQIMWKNANRSQTFVPSCISVGCWKFKGFAWLFRVFRLSNYPQIIS